jgi:hypothetical protein
LVRFAHVSSDAEAFRTRATRCRDVANGTKDIEAQRELRDLARDLDDEADKIEGEETARFDQDRSAER